MPPIKPLMFMNRKNVLGPLFGDYAGMNPNGLIKSKGGEVITPVFWAALTSSLNPYPTQGILDSFTRAATDEVTVTDFEGLVKDVTADEARFVGARRVENLVPNINDFAFSTSINLTLEKGIPDAFGGNNAVRITCTGGTTTDYTSGLIAKPIGPEVVASMYVRKVAGMDSGTLPMHRGNAVHATNIINDLTTEWQRFSVPVSEIVAGFVAAGFANRTWVTGDVLEVCAPQLEYVTGQANQNPSEYVSVGVGTEADLNESFLTSWTPSDGNWVADSDTAFSGTAATGNMNADWEAGKILNGRLYAIKYTISNKVSGSFQVHLGGSFEANSGGNGTYTNVLRATADGASLFFNGLTAFTGTISDVTVKEIDHGSNVDGVKYFDTLNYNTVSSNVVERVDSPAGAGVQQMVDPAFDTALALGESNADWTVSSGCQITGGLLNIPSGNIATPNFNPETGKYYRLRYKFTAEALLFPPTFGGVTLETTAGVEYDVLIKATDISTISLLSTGTTTLDYFYITPLTSIPDDYLKGVLVEEESTNLFWHSEDLSNGGGGSAWQHVSTTAGSGSHTIPTGEDNTTCELFEVAATSQHYVYQNKAVTVTDNTLTVYAAPNGRNRITLRESTASGASVTFELLGEGSVVAPPVGAATGTIEKASNGFYKCSATLTTTVGTRNWSINTNTDTGTGWESFLGDVTKGVLLTMGQLEELPYPTSYIPTAGATADRGVEELPYVNDIFDHNAVNDVTILLEVDAYPPADKLPVLGYFFDVYATAGRFLIGVDSTSNKIYALLTGGRFILSDLAITEGSAYKIIVRMSSVDGLHMFVGIDGAAGVKQASTDAGTADLDFSTTPSELYIGSRYTATAQLDSPIKGVKIYKKALTDAKCVELTS